MPNRSLQFRHRRRGATSPVVVVLMAGILIAIIVLIVVLLMGRNLPQSTDGQPASTGSSVSGGSRSLTEKPRAPEAAVVSPGQQVNREDLPSPPKSPKLVGNEKRIKEVAQIGKTYEMLIKGGFSARVEDIDWGVKQVTSLAFDFETQANRTIESNDGKQIVEVRHFQKVRAVKLLVDVESVTIELGLPGVVVLGALDNLEPGTGESVLFAKPIVEAVLRGGAQSVANSKVKEFWQVDSLSGKKVRITFIDGVGVQTIEPIGCSLTASERDFISNTAALSDYHTMPDVNIEPGKTWTVDASEFSGFFDPSMRGVLRGEVVIAREENHEEDGKFYAKLVIQPGSAVEIDSSNASTHRIGSFTPGGTLQYNITDGCIASARLIGNMQIETLSKDHILFEASFRTRPKLEISYSCKIR